MSSKFRFQAPVRRYRARVKIDHELVQLHYTDKLFWKIILLLYHYLY